MTSKTQAIRKAAQVIADDARKRAAHIGHKHSTGRAAASIRVRASESTATIAGGGSEAPELNMFENPRGRHKLFGDDQHWYPQPYRPVLEEAAEAKADDAMKTFANEVIDKMLKDNGI